MLCLSNEWWIIGSVTGNETSKAEMETSNGVNPF